MSGFRNPYDPNVKLSAGCTCGRHATPAEHAAALEADALASGSDALHARVVE
jgi:nitrate/nitrite transport system substrate-binding protein